MLLNEIIVKQDGGYVVYSHDKKKKLSRVYKSKEEAQKRLRQIEYFKHLSEEAQNSIQDFIRRLIK